MGNQFEVRSGVRRKIIALFVTLAMVFTAFAVPAYKSDNQVYAAAADTQVYVSYQSPAPTGFAVARQAVDVHPGLASEYNYSYGSNVTSKDITALDALVALHILIYGSDKSVVNENLTVGGGGFLGNAFGEDAMGLMTYVNGAQTHTAAGNTTFWDSYNGINAYTGDAVNQSIIKPNDIVEFFTIQDTSLWMDYFSWFEKDGQKVETIYALAGEEEDFDLVLKGIMNWYCLAVPGDYASKVEKLDEILVMSMLDSEESGALGSYRSLTFDSPVGYTDDGKVTIGADAAAGTYYYSAYDDEEYTPLFQPWLEIIVFSAAKVKQTAELIDALPADITLSDKADVTAARAAYNALSKSQKAEVSADYLPVLLAAEYRINALEQRHSATFDANGGKITSGIAKATVITNESYGNFPAVTKKGYTHSGWFTEKTGGTKVEAGEAVTQTTDHTLYAQWTPNNYKLTFNANGGKVKTASKAAIYDQTYGKLPTPTKSLKDFKGWYTAKTKGKKVSATTKYTSAKNVTVYAQWKNKNATVKVKTQKILKTKSSKAKVLKSAGKGDKVEVLLKSGKWYKVKYKNKTGWVPAKNVKLL